MDKNERLEVVNQLIKFISERGRRFFFCKSKETTANMIIKNNRVYFVDDYTRNEVHAYPSHTGRDGFSHGGTLWALVCDFSEFIRTGKQSNGVHGYGGLYGSGWGHSDEIQNEIINFAKKIGYLKG